MTFKILVVDDEPNVLNSLDRLLHREGFIVVKAVGGEAALEALDEHDDIAVVISDQRMPDLSGVEVLKEARIRRPDAVRIGLTGYADMDTILKCINEARVTRFILKPWDDDLLIELVCEAVIIYGSGEEDQRLQESIFDEYRKLQRLNTNLERKLSEKANTEASIRQEYVKGFKDIVKLLSDITEMQAAGMPGHGKRVARMSKELAKAVALPPDERDDVVIAALLHDIGKLAIPSNLLPRTEEDNFVRRHPQRGYEILKRISKFERIAEMVRHHHEAVSGNGYPEGLAGEAIPLGSRIIAIADMYDRCIFPSDEAVIGSQDGTEEELLKAAGEILDAGLVEIFLKVVLPAVQNLTTREVVVPTGLLKPGMELSRDIRDINGAIILKVGTILDDEKIGKLVMMNEYDPLLNKIVVAGSTLPTELKCTDNAASVGEGQSHSETE